VWQKTIFFDLMTIIKHMVYHKVLKMQMNIFFNYRHADERDMTMRIKDAIENNIGSDNVFIDDKIPPTAIWHEVLYSEVQKCDVLMAIIGPKWLDLLQNRLSNEDDYVRLEIEWALKLRKTILPVCIKGASIPSKDELPESIRGILQYQAISIADSRHFQRDIEDIINVLRSHNLNSKLNLDDGKLNSNNREQVLGSLANTSSSNPDIQKYLTEALLYLNHNSYARAVISYTNALTRDPKLYSAYLGRGLCLRMLGEWQAAISDYSVAIDLNPSFFEAFVNRGEAYHSLQQYADAINDYKKAIEINPENRSPYYNLGITFDVLKQHDKAIENYTNAISCEPYHLHSYRRRGIAFYDKQELEKAIQDFSFVIQVDTYDWRAYSHRGMVSSQATNNESTISDYKRAIQIVENYSNEKSDLHLLYCNLAFSYTQKSQLQKALENYNKAIQIRPDFADAYTSRGSIRDRLGKPNEALIDYSIALALNPLDVMAYNNRGWIKYKQGQLLEALEDYQQAVKIDPNMRIARENIDIVNRDLASS
jgi:tetratricopeptide (TPR) repeat protein